MTDQKNELTETWESIGKLTESLADTALPEEIVRDEKRWLRLLQEGSAHEKEFTVTQLSNIEARKLHDYILCCYGNLQYRGLLEELEVNFGF